MSTDDGAPMPDLDHAAPVPVDWTAELVEQLAWHWDEHLRERLAGMTDDEYFWEPVADCWSVRPRGTSSAPVAVGGGAMTIDFAIPEPDPAPVTTIAWRIGHLLVGVLGERLASHLGGAPVSYDTYSYPETADAALARLDVLVQAWLAGVRGLGDAGLARPCGPAEGPFADAPLAKLVLHIHREMIHHLAEIALLRDLYAHRG